MKRVCAIAWIAILELLYERVFYLLVSFSLLSLGLCLLLGQLTYAEQAKLTLDFMLGAIQISTTLFAIFMGISLFQRELTLGSVAMVLSKPISRGTFLVGKFLGQITMQFVVILAMAVITMAVGLRFGSHLSNLAVCQACLLIFLETTILTAITYFFAVNAGGVTTAIATLVMFGIGHLQESISRHVNTPGGKNIAWQMIQGVIPDLDGFNMKALASYGITISWMEVGWAVVYGGVCTLFFIGIALITFHHKDILT